ncbi:hypothetical protein EMCRGX_G016214 [Ephydatia muelleri]
MKTVYIFKTIFLLLLQLSQGRSWWLFSGKDEHPETDVSSDSQQQERRPAALPFEISSVEQKFLAEAQQYLDLSPLEQCQHKVITELKDTCADISEEDLAKLSVALLNCQSEIEGRQTFPCTRGMTIAECTSPMSADTWNAYHIMSNRARSVCYSIRQLQFRRQTEMAVNRLSQSTLEQLAAVQDLAHSHVEIKELASSSLKSVREQQDVLLEHQEKMLAAHESVRDRIVQNVRELGEEKALIHSGQLQLANMTQSIKEQLEVAARTLDIVDVRENIKEVWERIDNSTSDLLVLLQKLSSQYEATMRNLELINATIGSMLGVVTNMNGAINSQMGWIVEQVGGTKEALRLLTICSGHLLFLLLATLCVVFVSAPPPSRVALLLMVVGNVVAEVKFGASLSLQSLCLLEAFVVACNWLLTGFWRRKRMECPVQYLPAPPMVPSSRTEPPLKHNDPPPTKPSLDTTFSDDEDAIKESVKAEVFNVSADIPLHDTSLLNFPRPAPQFSTPTKSSATVVAHSTPRSALGQQQCASLTRAGFKCRLPAVPGLSYCRRHAQ